MKKSAWIVTKIGRDKATNLGVINLCKENKELNILLTTSNLMSIINSFNDSQLIISQQNDTKSNYIKNEYEVIDDSKKVPSEVMMTMIKSMFGDGISGIVMQPNMHEIEEIKKPSEDDIDTFIYFTLKDVVPDVFNEPIDLLCTMPDISNYITLCEKILAYAEDKFGEGMTPNRFRIKKQIIEGYNSPLYILTDNITSRFEPIILDTDFIASLNLAKETGQRIIYNQVVAKNNSVLFNSDEPKFGQDITQEVSILIIGDKDIFVSINSDVNEDDIIDNNPISGTIQKESAKKMKEVYCYNIKGHCQFIDN